LRARSFACRVTTSIRGAVLRGIDDSRENQIEANPVLRHFLCRALHKPNEAALARRIGGGLLPALIKLLVQLSIRCPWFIRRCDPAT